MPDPVPEVRRRIAEVADATKAARMQAYMKSAMPFRGTGSKPLRAVLREVLDAHRLPDRTAWEEAVRTLWDDAEFREERYAAIALAEHRYYRGYQDPNTLPLYRHLVVTGAWWDYVDPIASHQVGRILRGHHDAVAPTIERWACDEHLWVRRTAILCQLGSKDRTDLALLEHALTHNLEDSRHGRDFFIRKAVGWSLRQYARTDPDWVRAFVAAHEDRLSGLARREALKHLA